MQILPSLVLGCYVLVIICLGSLTIAPHHNTVAPELPSLRLTVVTPGHEAATSLIAPFGPGYDRDLLAEFCKSYDCDIRWTRAADRETALAMLRGGRADLAMGFATERQDLRGLTAGPVYYHSHEVEVRTKVAPLPALKTVDLGASATAEDAERQFLLNDRSWALWEPFVPLERHVSATAGAKESYQWIWNQRHASLNYGLNAFWQKLTASDNTLLRRLDERYYGYLPTSINPYAVQDLLGILKKRLPRYSSTIANASNKASIDPLLFTAVIIQESRMDESTVSHTGVRGIMQLTERTAAYLGVDRMNPTAAIGAGARYLNMLWKDLEDLELDPWDRWFFTLAAFNQGPRRLEGAMELSRKLGGTGRSWEELKEIFPLLTQKKFASMVGQDVCRGQEAVNFVERVRLSYHILRGLVALERPEAENLAPLLRHVGRSSLGL